MLFSVIVLGSRTRHAPSITIEFFFFFFFKLSCLTTVHYAGLMNFALDNNLPLTQHLFRAAGGVATPSPGQV